MAKSYTFFCRFEGWSLLKHGGLIQSLQLRNLFICSVYSLSGFDVTLSKKNLRLSDAPVSIRFKDGTSLITDSIKSIQTEIF